MFCRLHTTLAEAAELMCKNGCGFLPVVGEGGNVIGAITDRDMCIALGTRNKTAVEVLVRDVMLPKRYAFPKLFTCTPDDDIHCVLKTLRTARIRRSSTTEVAWWAFCLWMTSYCTPVYTRENTTFLVRTLWRPTSLYAPPRLCAGRRSLDDPMGLSHFANQAGMQEPEAEPTKAKRKPTRPPV